MGIWCCPPVLTRREVLERPTAWMTHHRRRSRDGEGTLTSREVVLSCTMTTRMVSQLARGAA